MALPNWGGNTRYVGPTGPTGPAGTPGTSGGQTLYLDSATSTSVPTLGSLLTLPVLTTQTTISHTASSSTVLIAKFPTTVGILPSTFVPPGLWDLNIYAATSSLTNAPSFYWSLYQVDADGVSNPVLISDGAADPILITNLVASQTIYDSPLYISAYTLTNSTKRLSIYLYVNYVGGNRTATFEFRNGAVSHIHTTLGEIAYNWSSFPATQDVNIAGYNVSNVGTLTASVINSATTTTTYLNSTVTNANTVNAGVVATTNVSNGSSSNALTLQSPSNDTNVLGNRVFVRADQNAVVSAYSDVTITASNGNRGRINLTSSEGYLNGLAGEVNITANGGTVGVYPADYATGGLVNITANTPVGSYYTTTSAIKLSAASVLSYAGAVSPVGSLLGYNYIQGTLGVNIIAGTASSVPNVAGTNYLYGVNGTTIQNTLYTDTIRNIIAGDLNLASTSNNINLAVAASNASISLTASNTGANIVLTSPDIRFVGPLNMTNNAISNCTSLSSSNSLTLNANAFSNIVLNANTVVVDGNMNLSNHVLFNVSNIQANSNLILSSTTGGNIVLSNIGFFNMSGFNISNVGNITGSNTTLSTSGNLTLTSSTSSQIVAGVDLNMSNHNISNVSNLYSAGIIGVDRNALIFGSSFSRLTSESNLSVESVTGYVELNANAGAGTIYLTASNIEARGKLYMLNNAISNVGSMTMTSAGNVNMSGGSISNISNLTGVAGGTLTISNTDHYITLPAPGTTYATGGTITQSGGRTYHTFTSSGTFTILVSVGTVEVMAVGGGGGGGGISGGGGGGGNLVVVQGTLGVGAYTVTVGTGGAGGTASSSGSAGGLSRFSATGINIRAIGGGGGGTTGYSGGGNGGCGGGGSAGTESFGGSAGFGVISGMTNVSNVAFAGGSNPNAGNTGPAGSGGGGTTSVGVAVSGISPSDGGDGGTAILYRGTYYGGGGGGSAAPTSAYGTPHKGRGGGTAPPTSGGNGSLGATSTQAQVGVANTGGGGGGGEDAAGGYAGAAGGSGIVIVSYATPTPPQFTLGTTGEILMNAPTVVVSNDLTINGITNLGVVSVSNLTVGTITASSNATFNGTTTAITGKLVGQNAKPIAIATGLANGYWNPTTVGTVTASGSAAFSNADNPSGFAVADFNAYMSLLSFNNLNSTNFYLSDQRIQQNSSGTYWTADVDAKAYSPNVYLSNQNVEWIVNAMFIPKSLCPV